MLNDLSKCCRMLRGMLLGFTALVWLTKFSWYAIFIKVPLQNPSASMMFKLSASMGILILAAVCEGAYRFRGHPVGQLRYLAEQAAHLILFAASLALIMSMMGRFTDSLPNKDKLDQVIRLAMVACGIAAAQELYITSCAENFGYWVFRIAAKRQLAKEFQTAKY